jgi:hypothetical protein
MKPICALALFFVAAAAFAQSAEYGQASAGTIDMTTKQARQFSGSLSFTSGLGLGASFGGTAVKDRVWYFASGEKSRSVFNTSVPLRTTDLNTSFVRTAPPLTIPSSFLTLHSTSVFSPNSFVTIDVSQSRH